MFYGERTTGEVIHALERWEAGHPWPNESSLVIGDRVWKPWEFMAVVKRGGSPADELLDFIYAQARKLGEDPLDYVGRMIREAGIREEDSFGTI